MKPKLKNFLGTIGYKLLEAVCSASLIVIMLAVFFCIVKGLGWILYHFEWMARLVVGSTDPVGSSGAVALVVGMVVLCFFVGLISAIKWLINTWNES